MPEETTPPTNEKPAIPFNKVPFSYDTQHEFPEAEPILDPTCVFEEQDRGQGMAVDDIKTYHRTEK